MKQETSNGKIYFPIILVVSYLIFTEILYFIGPIKWGKINYSKLLLFLFFSKLMLILGYRRGMKKKIVINKNANINKNTDIIAIKILKIILILSITMNILFIITKTGSLSLSNILNKIIVGIKNPSINYQDKFGIQSQSLYSAFAPFYTLFSLFTFATIPFSFYYYKNLKLNLKFLVIINLFIELSRWFIIGTNKGIIDVIIIFGSIFLLNYLQKKKKQRNFFRKTINLKKIVSMFFLVIIMFLGLSFFFTNINGRLEGNSSYILYSINNASLKNNTFYNNIPNTLYSILVYMQAYLSQGYYGLGLALNINFVPMFGIGFSNFLIENIGTFFGPDFYLKSYIERIAPFGWSSTVNWHTAYTWFANDVSFVGVVFIMFLIGYYFARIVKHALNKDSCLFIPLFSIMIIMFFYFPMNNQIFNNPNQFMGFVGLNIIWFRCKYIKKYF